jgi:hypothetical protein
MEATSYNQGFQFGSYFWSPLDSEKTAFKAAKDILVKVSAPPVSGAAPGLTLSVIALGTDGSWYEVASQSVPRDSSFHWLTFQVAGQRWRKFSRTCTNQGVRGVCMPTADCQAGGGVATPSSTSGNVAGCNKLPTDVQCCTGRGGVGYSLSLPSVTMFALLVTTDDRSFTSQSLKVSQWHLCSGTISSGGDSGGDGGNTGCTNCNAAGMVCRNGECVCSNSGAYEITADGGCAALDSEYVCKHCPPAESYRYATRRTSSDNFHGDCYLDFASESFKCACDTGYAYDESLKKCVVAPCNPTCAATKAQCVNGKCECALNYKATSPNADGSNCVQDTSGCTPACVAPYGCDTKSGTCKCPSGTFTSGNACVKTCSPACSAAKFEECTGTATSSSCTCQASYTRETGTNGACVRACSENCATTGRQCVNGQCKCPDNQRENTAGACVATVQAETTPETEERVTTARASTCTPACNHVKERCNTAANPIACECLPDWQSTNGNCVNECAACTGVQRDCNTETKECTCPRLWEFDEASGDCIQTSASVTGGEDLVDTNAAGSEDLTTEELIAIIGGSVGGCCCLISVVCICMYICSRVCASEELPPPIPMDGKEGGLYNGASGSSSYGGGGSYPNQQGYGGYNQGGYNTTSSYGGGGGTTASPLGAY